MYSTDKHTAPETSIIQIAKTDCYELQYDELSNRIYLTLLGYWKDKEVVPEYLNDWQKAIKLTRPDFSLLLDMRTMITHPPSLNSLHLEVHNLIKDNSASQIALLEPIDRIATLQIQQIIAQCDMQISSFLNADEAEEWLNAG
ncbi:hypothetical protein ACFSRY_08890 [Pontibacter locisalis]|uniref:SpoIIAA-like n=1 Tax=Pontibacter locisalis TaxID=1719035 RepID=A0ABW5IMC5_9BACT